MMAVSLVYAFYILIPCFSSRTYTSDRTTVIKLEICHVRETISGYSKRITNAIILADFRVVDSPLRREDFLLAMNFITMEKNIL